MGKMLTVIDEPLWCFECPFFNSGIDSKCKKADRLIKSISLSKRPDWCPLIEVPDKKNTWDMDIVDHQSMDLGEHIGWNKCINYILEEGIRKDEDS